MPTRRTGCEWVGFFTKRWRLTFNEVLSQTRRPFKSQLRAAALMEAVMTREQQKILRLLTERLAPIIVPQKTP